jgi:thioredoxin-related protein
MIYMDKQGKINPVPGYMSAIDIQPVLIFFGEDIHKSTPFDKFNTYFKKTYRDSIQEQDLVEWLTLEEALKQQKRKPKKMLIQFYGSYSAASNIFQTVLKDTAIAEYINETYYPVRFDVLSEATVEAFDTTFINKKQKHPFHNFPVALLNGNMSLPALAIMNEEQKIMDRVQFFTTPVDLLPILHYYGEDVLGKQSWADYRKDFYSARPKP